MADWGPGNNTTGPADQWGNGGGSNDFGTNDFGTNDNFGGTNFDDDQFGGGAADGFDNGFGGGSGAVDGGRANGGGDRTCYNCGQEGHNKADCTNPSVPREFTGTCRVCEKEGHMAKDCPDKPPAQCRNCGEEGHHAVECKNPRKIDRSEVDDVLTEQAWEQLLTAVKENDMDDVKIAVQQYVKSCPDTTYLSLEQAFRQQDIGLYFIAIEKPIMATMTNMDFQGNLDKTYTVTYRFDSRAARPREVPSWPKSPEENEERLKDAGEVVTRGLPKCSNCEQLGHISKNCDQEKMEKERVIIKCFNCDEEGHRIRDCPKERYDPFACKNCKEPGHKAADCPMPRVAGPDVECRKCNGMGHFSRDCPEGGGGGSHACFNCGEEGHSSKECTNPKKITCRNCDGEGHRANECPEPRNMEKVQCRNCDEYGHESRQCPKPRDWSRVTCSNCGETGHTKVRCKKETVAPDSFDDDPTPIPDMGTIDTSDWNTGGDMPTSTDTGGWDGNVGGGGNNW